MATVVDFPGVTMNDVPVEDVLDGAKKCDHVVVIGWNGDDLYMAMSKSEITENLLLIRCADRLMMDTLLALSAE